LTIEYWRLKVSLLESFGFWVKLCRIKLLVPDKLNSVLFGQKIENPHWGRAGRNRQFSIVNIQLKTSMIKTLNLKWTFLFWLVQVRVLKSERDTLCTD